jgi:REP element-mobilizing transposase RayT
VSPLPAHLVFVTNHRRKVFTGRLTFCEHTMRTVYDELDVELVEFNGETDHVHLLRRRTVAGYQVLHRRTSPTTMSTRPRPSTERMG